jgi:hypothetical protein
MTSQWRIVTDERGVTELKLHSGVKRFDGQAGRFPRDALAQAH